MGGCGNHGRDMGQLAAGVAGMETVTEEEAGAETVMGGWRCNSSGAAGDLIWQWGRGGGIVMEEVGAAGDVTAADRGMSRLARSTFLRPMLGGLGVVMMGRST